MSEQYRILVTGATGFIGRSVIETLLNKRLHVLAAVRNEKNSLPEDVERLNYNILFSDGDILGQVTPVDYVIHLAARVHIMGDNSNDPLMAFRQVNVGGAINLAKQAAERGVKRFIFISSAKANGEYTETGKPFVESDKFVPSDPYGLSKYEAEQGLLEIARDTGMQVVIIRPPLVYGPGVKANFATMMNIVNKGFPLPFGAIHNQRSLVALDNLVSFIVHCIEHPKAANEIFLVSDGEDISTTELLKKVARSLDRKPCLIPVPVGMMKFIAKLVGKEDVANRLLGSLQVDSSKARDLLGWKPVTTMDEQLKKTADAYLK